LAADSSSLQPVRRPAAGSTPRAAAALQFVPANLQFVAAPWRTQRAACTILASATAVVSPGTHAA
jgi:hypothetical protein